MNLELDPLRQAGARRQPRQPHGFLRVARAAGVRQKKKTFRIDKIENVRKRIVFARNIGAPQRHRHHLGAAGDERVAHQFVRREFPRANESARREFAIGDLQFRRLVRHCETKRIRSAIHSEQTAATRSFEPPVSVLIIVAMSARAARNGTRLTFWLYEVTVTHICFHDAIRSSPARLHQGNVAPRG